MGGVERPVLQFGGRSGKCGFMFLMLATYLVRDAEMELRVDKHHHPRDCPRMKLFIVQSNHRTSNRI